jgi:hypothetical protein
LLGRAFASGKLYFPVNPQPEALALPDTEQNRRIGPYTLLDTVLYKGHYYLYHGATPALLLFAPWYLFTRHDLPENFAAFLLALGAYAFLSILFLQVLSFLARPRHPALLTLCLLALGIGQMVPFLLHRVKVYEIAIVCGYFCVSAGFFFLFQRLVTPQRRTLWSGLSGLFLGLAVGARPHLGLAAASAFVFLVLLADPGTHWFQRFTRKEILAFVLPVIACCLALATYNYVRFGDPRDFGLTHQITDFPNVRLSKIYLVPGLYYLLWCPLDLVPEFPFFRIAWRPPFDSFAKMPPRYFLEPTAGILSLCPLAAIAILAPFCRRRFGGRRELFAFVSVVLAFAVACIFFVAATGFSSQRYEADFLPFLVFVACVVGCELLTNLRKWPGIFASTAFAVLLLYTIGANAALALQGPYDQFVQGNPHSYVKLAGLFSPLERFRPLENPGLRLQASFDFSWPCKPERAALISTGEFGSRYLLTAECEPNGRLKLVSETAIRSADWAAVYAPYSTGLNHVGLKFTPEDRTVTISWNSKVVLRQHLRFLVTAPSQIHFGWDPTWGNKATFPRRIVVFQQDISSR